jgi:hypothetical protein
VSLSRDEEEKTENGLVFFCRCLKANCGVIIMGKVLKFPKPELSKEIVQDNKKVRIDVYSDGEKGWLLEIVDKHWNSTCWDKPFKTAQDALKEGIMAVEKEGIDEFIGKPISSDDH